MIPVMGLYGRPDRSAHEIRHGGGGGEVSSCRSTSTIDLAARLLSPAEAYGHRTDVNDDTEVIDFTIGFTRTWDGTAGGSRRDEAIAGLVAGVGEDRSC
jgi:hypothetical protein